METKTLQLTLKKEWFDKILSGEKTEEYREIKDYWLSRFLDCDENKSNHLCAKKLCYACLLYGQSTYIKKDVNSIVTPKFSNYEFIEFINGYGRDKPRFTIECLGITTGIGKSGWGAPEKEKVFILKLGKIVSTYNI